MPRKRALHERVADRLEGKDPDEAEKKAKAKKGAEKLSGSPEAVIRALSVKQRAALHRVLDDLVYDDFKFRDEVEAEEREDDEDE